MIVVDNDSHGTHMAYFFTLMLHFFSFFFTSTSRGWRKWQSKSSQFVKHTFSVLSRSHRARLTDRQKSWIMQILRVCPSWTDWISLISSESRVLLFVPAWRWWPATFSFWFWIRCLAFPFTPQWPQCLSDVWAHWQGVVSLCECAKPAPGKHKKKKKGEKICWRWKRWVLNKEWAGGFAWINTAQMQVDDGRALLVGP